MIISHEEFINALENDTFTAISVSTLLSKRIDVAHREPDKFYVKLRLPNGGDEFQNWCHEAGIAFKFCFSSRYVSMSYTGPLYFYYSFESKEDLLHVALTWDDKYN